MSLPAPAVPLASGDIDLTGYRMPAEWEPHTATWLAWPFNLETWPEHLSQVRQTYARMIEALTQHEIVRLLVNDSADTDPILETLASTQANLDHLQLLPIPHDDAWMRDAGPIFITRPGAAHPLIAHDFIFNTWGQKYGPWDQDDVIPRYAAALLGCPVIAHDLVLEGGSIEVNGQGTLLTTRQCLLNPNRNPSLTAEQIEERLRLNLGVTHILWLDDGIEGDDTDGHIDDLSRFVNPDTVITVIEDDQNDPNYRPLKQNIDLLEKLRNASGSQLTVIDIPMPRKRLEGPFGRSPASYANFYIANHTVLVPIYSDANDEKALNTIQEAFPDRTIVGIECSALVTGLGSIHCVTQQEPSV